MAVRQVRLGDVLELARRRSRSRSREVHRGRCSAPSARASSTSRRSGAETGTKKVYRVEPGDLVISKVFAWEGALAVASESERD